MVEQVATNLDVNYAVIVIIIVLLGMTIWQIYVFNKIHTRLEKINEKINKIMKNRKIKFDED